MDSALLLEYSAPGAVSAAGAVMDPGHEGRHDHNGTGATTTQTLGPQWSPVMKTGKTGARIEPTIASLEPQWSPVVKTREDVLVRKGSPGWRSRNGSRS